MSKKKSHPIDEPSPSHIRAYCVKEDLQKLLFRTNIKVYCFDSKPTNKKDSIVVIALKTADDAQIVADVLSGFIQEHGDEFRNIEVDVMLASNARLQGYLDGGVC